VPGPFPCLVPQASCSTIEGSRYVGGSPSLAIGRCCFHGRPRQLGVQCHPLAVDVSVLPPARSGYGEELLVAARSRARPRRMFKPRADSASPCSPAPACIVGRLIHPRQLKLGKSSSLSPGVVREFGQWRRQMYCSLSSPATSALGKEVQEKGLQGRCPSQSSHT
jgi:hypothetical protein